MDATSDIDEVDEDQERAANTNQLLSAVLIFFIFFLHFWLYCSFFVKQWNIKTACHLSVSFLYIAHFSLHLLVCSLKRLKYKTVSLFTLKYRCTVTVP